MRRKKQVVVMAGVLLVVVGVSTLVVFRRPLEVAWLVVRVKSLCVGNAEEFFEREVKRVDVEYMRYGVENFDRLPWYHPLRDAELGDGIASSMLGRVGDEESLRLLERMYYRLKEQLEGRHCRRGSKEEKECMREISWVVWGLASSRRYDQKKLYEMVMRERGRDARVFMMASAAAKMAWSERGDEETEELWDKMDKEYVKWRKERKRKKVVIRKEQGGSGQERKGVER